MLALSLIWLAIGLVVGALGVAARLTPARWQRRRWLALPALGAVAALAGGWLGTLLLGHIFASFVAIWLSVGVIGAVALFTRWRMVATAQR